MAKILVIDDEESIRTYFERSLSRMGHEAVLAENGEAGCEQAKQPDIKVIITDMRMPGALGELELIRALRQLRPELPLIVISGYGNEAMLRDCQDLGVTDFLSKPFELSFVRSVITDVLGEPESEQA